jgi:hypothetical protein
MHATHACSLRRRASRAASMQVLDLLQSAACVVEVPPEVADGAIRVAAAAGAPALAARAAVTAAQHGLPLTAACTAAALHTCLHSSALDECALPPSPPRGALHVPPHPTCMPLMHAGWCLG